MAERVSRPTPAALSGVPVLHPPLLAIYRALLLYANNMDKTPISSVVRPILVLAAAALALWLVLWVVLRNRYKAGLVASILIIASLTGWHVLEFGITAFPKYLWDFPAEGFYVFYAGAIAVGLVLIVRRYRERPRVAAALLLCGLLGAVGVMLIVVYFLAPAFQAGPSWMIVSYLAVAAAAIAVVIVRPAEYKTLTQTANWFALILVGISVALIFVHRPAPKVSPEAVIATRPLEGLATSASDANPKPDIYLVVLDGYARDDVLRQDYHFNNVHFLDDMREKGFWVADKSVSNYSLALPSLTSCLNLDYVQSLLPEPGADSIDTLDMVNLYHHNRLYAFLKEEGYRLVVFSPGGELTEPRDNVDEILKPTGALSEFEAVLLETSIAGRMMALYDYWMYGSPNHSAQQAQRRRVLFAFDRLGELAESAGDQPRFIMAHLMLPQPRFLFDRDGGWPNTSDLLIPEEDGTPRINQESFRRHYNDQLQYMNRMLAETVDRILKKSATPPVIVILSSRGPARLKPGEASATRLREGFGNLILVHLPGRPADQPVLEPGQATPMNVLRAVLNRTAGTQVPLAKPEAYICNERPEGIHEFQRVAVEVIESVEPTLH